jgi:hypothetical protein
MTAVVVIEIAENPNAGMIHFYGGGNAFCGAEPQHRNSSGIGDRIAVEGHDLEGVTGKRQTANLRGAAIENVKQDALALFDANGFAVPEHPAVNGEGFVADFETLGHAFGERGFHRRFPGIFEGLYFAGGREEVHVHIAAAAELRVEFLQYQKHFAIEIPGRRFWLDVHRPDLAAVLPGGEIGARAIVGVIEAKTRGIGSEGDAALAIRGNEGSAFLGGAIDFVGDALAVPMKLFGRVGFVEDVDGDGLAFFETQQRAGKDTIVGSRGNDALGRDFEGGVANVQGVVGRGFIGNRSESDRAPKARCETGGAKRKRRGA